MRKYLTWRCIGLHVLVLVLVPGFLVAGWWQYHVALGGNDLSWVYTVEWPFFAVYAVYIWWKLIHDDRTPFDRLWAAKQRAAADAEGKPLHEIPGWATDRALSREVHLASRAAARHPALSGPRLHALDRGADRASLVPAVPDRAEDHGSLSDLTASLASTSDRADADRPDPGPEDPELPDPELPDPEQPDPEQPDPELQAVTRDGGSGGGAGTVIDAEVVDVKVSVDEELDAYNRYLFELSRSGPPKRWSPRRPKRSGEPVAQERATPTPTNGRPALPSANESG